MCVSPWVLLKASSVSYQARATLQRSQKQQSGLRRRTPNERSLQRSYTAVGDTQGDEYPIG